MSCYLNCLRPQRDYEAEESSDTLIAGKTSRIATRESQMFSRFESKQKQTESDQAFAERLTKTHKEVRNQSEPFFLKPEAGTPFTNTSQEIRRFLASNVSDHNKIHRNEPCWNATVARKICETQSHHSGLTLEDQSNINKYLCHSAAVAKSHYVIEKPSAVVRTKELIKSHIFHSDAKHKMIHIPVKKGKSDDESDSDDNVSTCDSESSVPSHASSIPYAGVADCIPDYEDHVTNYPKVSHKHFRDKMYSMWPVHRNARNVNKRQIFDLIIHPDPEAKEYYLCDPKGPLAQKCKRAEGLASMLEKEYRCARTEQRAQYIAEVLKRRNSLTASEIEEWVKNWKGDGVVPNVPRPPFARPEQKTKYPYSGEEKTLGSMVHKRWKALKKSRSVPRLFSEKTLTDTQFIETHIDDGKWPDLAVIRDNPIWGNGVVAANVLTEGRVVCDYKGEFLSKQEQTSVSQTLQQE